MGRWFGFRIGYEDTIMICMPNDQIAWYRDILNLELELRDDLAQMNEREMTPSMWEIKMVNSKSFESLNKKLKLTDENRLRNTQKKKLSFGGTNQMTKFVESIASVKIFEKNILYKDDTNINFSNIPVLDVLAFLSKYQFHSKDEILYSVQNYLNLNSRMLHSFSVVIKQKIYNYKDELKPTWQIVDKSKNVSQNITGLQRKDANISDEFYFNDNLIDANKDNTFDILDSETKAAEYKIFKDESRAAQYIYKLRNESKKAILIIYIIKGKMERDKSDIYFPSLYLSIPNVGEPVTYTIRNR